MSWIEDLIKSRLVQLSDTIHETVAPIIYNTRTREKVEKLAKEGTERLRQLRMQGKQAVIRPDTRTSDLRARDNKETDYRHQLYQKLLDDLKRAEGLENLMKFTSPSTYVEAATGEQLTPGGRLAADALVFGIGGAAKSLLTRGGSKAVSRSVLGLARGINGKVPSTPAEWTAAQDAAIARGDMAEAQRLRDLHFKVSAPNTKVIDSNDMPTHNYHGTKTKFNEFDLKYFGQHDPGDRGRGFYFSQNRDVASDYGNIINDYYLNATTPYTGKDWYGKYINRGSKKDIIKQIHNKIGIEDARKIKFLKEKYPNLDDKLIRGAVSKSSSLERENIISNLGNIENTDGYLSSYENVVYKPNQIKSADAVTYDDEGIRIPLGERDNFNINDIRFFSTHPITRANPVHTTEGNPLVTRLARLREHTQYGFTPETNLGLMITPLLRVNNVRNFAKQIDPSLTDDLLDLIVQIAYANGRGVHIPIGNNTGATTGGLSIVDIQDAINYLKLSGIKNITSNDIGIIAGHEAGHGVQISNAAKKAIEGFSEPEEFYTRAGQVLDAAGIKSTANNRILFNLFMNMIDDYLAKGNLDNGVSAIRDFLRSKTNVLTRQLIMKHINELSAVSGAAYLTNKRATNSWKLNTDD